MVSYIVAASVFVLGSSYLVHFVIEPPGAATSNLEHLDQRMVGRHALEVLLETPGYPKTWGTSVSTLDRLGVIEVGTSIRVDPAKFDAIARGKSDSSTAANNDVDYAEAKVALGLSGYDFHLRAYPVLDQNAADYGMRGLENFRVAYIGDLTGETYGVSAMYEADALDQLALKFTNKTRTSDITGDVFRDDGQVIREFLLPNISATLYQDVISEGSGIKYDFSRVAPAAYQGLTTLNVSGAGLSHAMALSSDGYTLGYTKNRELRSIVGTVDMTGLASATLVWAEWVDTGRENATYDCGDYGFVEVSKDNGVTWDRLTDTTGDRSQDCNQPVTEIHTAQMASRTVTIPACVCPNLLVAFHWVGDNDNTIGYGWVVDNVRVSSPTGALLLGKTFTSTEYDLVVIGSDTDHSTFTSADVKNTIRDYVDRLGGNLVVLGGSAPSTQWLERLFDVGVGGAAGGSSATDGSHPFLNIPNTLSYTTYTKGAAWDLGDADRAGLFDLVVADSPTRQHLSVSKTGTWGSDGGDVILTSFEPHAWSKDETRRFFANAALQGRYHYLHIDMGPPIPANEDVASASRSATMNFRKDGGTEFGEMVFEIHVWPGASASQTLAASTTDASAPRSLTTGAADRLAWVNFTWPLANGTGTPLTYNIYRANSSDAAVAATEAQAKLPVATMNWVYRDENFSAAHNGNTTWYTVRLETSTGVGAPSVPVSATPYALPGAPGTPTGAGGLGKIDVTWTRPDATGPTTILGYRVYANDSLSSTTYSLLGEVGNVTTYVFTTNDPWSRSFKVEALNGRGWGATSAASVAVAPLVPANPPTLLAVTNVTAGRLDLTWAAPGVFGTGTHTGYKIQRGLNSNVFTEFATLNDPNNVSFEDNNVAGNTQYWYKVRATTSVGDGLLSDPADKWTKDPNLPAAHPASFNATGAVAGRITLTWTPPSSNGAGTLLGYSINRSTSSAIDTAGTLLVYLADPNNLSFVDYNIAGSTPYWYRVRAVTTVAQGFNSSTEIASSTFALPSTPTGFAVSNATANQLTLTWDDHTGDWGVPDVGVSFKIYRSTDGSSFTLLASTLTATNTSFADATAADNTTYWYKIAATSTVGDSAQTSAASATAISSPWQVLGLAQTGSDPALQRISMAWNAPVSNGGSAVTSYQIYRGSTTADMVLYATTADGTTVTYTDLTAVGGPWYYKVRATNAADSGPFSAAVQMSA